MDKGSLSTVPLGIFWDIENCAVPRSKSALHVVKIIREKFSKEDTREVEFMCVCDTAKENKNVIQELNQAQVNVVHIDAVSKNAADDKLRQSIRRFADTYSPPAFIVLITSDINFSTDLYDLRYRKKFDIILMHRAQTHDSLILCANEHFVYDDVVKDVPSRSQSKSPEPQFELTVKGFPKKKATKRIKCKLQKLCNNTGGKVVFITTECAVIRFSSSSDANRARHRMDGHDVFGSRIQVDYSAPGSYSTQTNAGNNHTGGHLQHDNNVSPDRDRPYSQKKSRHHRKPANVNSDENNNNYIGSMPQEGEFASPDLGYGNQTEDGNYGIQELVQKFTQEKKSSRQMLMLQQQMYQEGQTPMQDYGAHSTQFYSQYKETNYYGGYNQQWQQGDYQHYPQQQYHDNNAYYNNSYQNTSQSSSPYYYGNNRGFCPIKAGSSTNSSASSSPCEFDVPNDIPGSVDLIVSNLDYNISPREWKHILMTTFHPHVKIWHIDVSLQPDNTSLGLIKVGSIDEARFAISQFHRKKIGYKRIHVTLKSTESVKTVSNVRSEAIALLSEAKGNVLPLFKFIELFNKRFNRPISVAELYKMRDTIEVREQGGAGRMIHLVPSLQGSPVPEDKEDGEVQEILEHVVCLYHCPEGSSMYAEAVNTSILPNVKVQLKTFAAQVHSLLMTHDDNLPLKSFTACYAAEVMPLAFVYEGGVPLEHLISCVPGIEILTSSTGVKKVSWSENKPPSSPDLNRPGSSPVLVQQLGQLSREMVDLLKASPGCRMAFTKFIPSYHHHFGRQCRVADYGYSKLMELFEAIPHVLQILGTGDRKVLTLTHRAQSKRFTADLLRLLKNIPGKQIYLSTLSDEFCKLFSKSWDITEYGVCYVEDMLGDLPAGTVNLTLEGNETVLSLPRKDQSSEEMERTKQFALEVIDILKHSHQCRMLFNKFIPAYHHHFGRQCRVSDYGFIKLQDLFEAIPDIVVLEDEGEEKVICLSEPELRKVVGEQIVSMLRQKHVECFPLDRLMPSYMQHYGYQIPLNDFHVFTIEELMSKLKHVLKCFPLDRLMPSYMQHYGYQIPLNDFHVFTIEELMSKLKHVLKIEQCDNKCYVVLADRTSAPPLARQVLQLLMDQSGGSLPLMELCSRYKTTFDVDQGVKVDFKLHLMIEQYDSKCYVVLADRTSAPPLARQVLQLLMDQSGGSLPLMELCSRYKTTFGVDPDIKKIKEELLDYVSISGDDESGVISLTPLQILARDIRILLQQHGKVSLHNFEKLYYEKFCSEIKPALYGFPTTVALLVAIPHVVSIKGKGQRRIVHLSGDLQSSMPIIDESSCRPDSDTPSNDSGSALTDEETPIDKSRPSPLDLLGGSVPSNVPSPQLLPSPTDLIRFSPCVTEFGDKLFSMSDDDKRNLDSPLCHTPTSQILKLAAQFLPTSAAEASHAQAGRSTTPTNILKPDTNTSGNIMDLLKQGLTKEVKYPPSNVTAKSQDSSSNEKNQSNLGGQIENFAQQKDRSIETLKASSVSATIALLRRQREGIKPGNVTQQTSAAKEKDNPAEAVSKKEIKSGPEEKEQDETVTSPVALCPRPLQPGSYWFSKQFENRNNDELPCTSPEDVRKVLASLSSQRVKAPSKQETSMPTKLHSKISDDSSSATKPQDQDRPTNIEPVSATIPQVSEKAILKPQVNIPAKTTRSIFTESKMLKTADHTRDHGHKLENCVAEDCMCYEAVFREDHDFATSTVKSDSSMSGGSQPPSPVKSPKVNQPKVSSGSQSDDSQNNSMSHHRKSRIAAKFEHPVAT